ncbi:sulfite exporter TauE/SafE family protein [Bacillus tianshenii]|nr:sulfite exporter TauE/SafE family protein [Bacillus tianshenii]
MYDVFTQISNLFTGPFLNMANQTTSFPLLSALFLGIVGALAPCQLTGNLGAMTIYGNQSLQKKVSWLDVWAFILGKVVVFTGLGLLVWLLGQEFQRSLTGLFPLLRKVIGPLLIIIGLFMLGWIKMHWTMKLGSIPERFIKQGKLGSFLMGFSFSLAFCPTMFVLFFITLMPLVLSTSYGMALPSVFAIGTSLPLLIAVWLISWLGLDGRFLRKSRHIGQIVQKSAGVLLLLLGVLDTISYWTI